MVDVRRIGGGSVGCICAKEETILLLELEEALEPEAMSVIACSLELGPLVGFKVFSRFEAGLVMMRVPSLGPREGI